MATVALLDRLIQQVRVDHGEPHLQVDIIGHSMGGLIARYYSRYGTRDLLDGNEFEVTQAGARKVRRLILVGTPNLDFVEAMHSLIVGGNLGFRGTYPEVITTMPAIYQLYPHALHQWCIPQRVERWSVTSLTPTFGCSSRCAPGVRPCVVAFNSAWENRRRSSIWQPWKPIFAITWNVPGALPGH